MARSRKMRKTRKHARRMRKHRGGGGGSGWEPDGRLSAETPYAMVNKVYDGCMTTSRPGAISFSATGGLPGMRGGAYTNNLSSPIAGFSQIDRDTSHCAPNHVNRLNQHGGAGTLSASGAPILQEDTARYMQSASQWRDSVGAPVLLNQPLSQTAWSRACTQTAGRRRMRKSKKSRKSKKTRRH
jgi:hypothetical protein